MYPQNSEKGELLLPILAVLFLFGMFWIAYVVWCRQVYWDMRLDMTGDAVALSAAREEAAMLNTIGALQYLENGLLQKGKVEGTDIGAVQISAVNEFEEYNRLMKLTIEKLFPAYTSLVAFEVAKANGADIPPVPLQRPQSYLKPQGVYVAFLHVVIPAGGKYYPAAYYARDWFPDKVAPQPPHKCTWWVHRGNSFGKGKASLWLDVDPTSGLNNGGFPSPRAAGLRGLGIQCNFPQFNARLMPKD